MKERSGGKVHSRRGTVTGAEILWLDALPLAN